LKPSGVIFSAARADRGQEFIRTSDNWVRPVNFVNAPDGSLYVLDMYRETVEHPYSIPVEIKQFLHLESGDDRGRIYRIVSPDMRRIRPQSLGAMDNAGLVQQLESENAWNRETAQRLLCQHRDQSSVVLLEALIRSSPQPLARLHALWTLAGMSALRPDLLIQTLSRETHARVREHAVRVSEPLLKSSPKLAAALLKLTDDADERVRFQIALSLGEAAPETALKGLQQLAEDSRNQGDIRVAMLSSTAGIAGRLAAAIVGDPGLMKQPHVAGLLAELGLLVGSDRDDRPAVRLLLAATADKRPLATQQQVLALLGRGLSRRGYSVSKLVSSETATPELRRQVARVFQRASAIAADQNRPAAQRAQAAGVLAFADFKTASAPLSGLLTPQTPQALQRAAVAALAQQEAADTADLLLSGWRGYSPQVRRDVVDGLLLRVPRVLTLLAAVENMTVVRSDLERDKKQLLMNHPNAPVRDRSRKLFGDGAQTQRSRVVAEYQKVLDLDGNAERGLDVFKKKCAVCHRVGDVGHRVAPDLVSVKNKSEADFYGMDILKERREKALERGYKSAPLQDIRTRPVPYKDG
ncbi:MAG: HEAT repeat domain-containing protein, partial [Planctomycetaceae bacterium]